MKNTKIKAAFAAVLLSVSGVGVASELILEKVPVKTSHINLQVLNQEIDVLKNRAESEYDISKIAKLSDEILDRLYDVSIAKGDILHFNEKLGSKLLANNAMKSYSNNGAEPGDYLVIKFKKEHAQKWGVDSRSVGALIIIWGK